MKYMEKEISNVFFDDYKDFEIISGTTKHFFPLHTHRYLCVGKITKGNVIFICDGIKTTLSVGSEYIIPPNCPHAFNPIEDKPYSYVTLCLKNTTNDTSNKTEYISKTVSIIENSSTPSFSIDDICKIINLSKFHFIRQFKLEVGLTPYQFILNTKIRKIRQGLLSKQTLSDLALDLGFSDQSHMCNTFKKYMGISPLQFYQKYKMY